MQRTPVVSSHLAAVGYDAHTRILEVEFVNGQIYQYFRVPPEIYRGLLKSETVGGYFQKYVKDASYCYTNITGGPVA